MERPAVSLVICTRNRANQLKVCLGYVARQQPSCSWELVVVDNGSSDGTAALLAEYTAKVAFPATVIFEGVSGLGRARNAGWTAASGEIIAFTDDDCYVAPDHIDRVRETFGDANIGFAGGRVDLFDPADYPITIKTSDERELIERGSFLRAGVIHGANMMFRRRVLEEIGGFDPDLGSGTRFCCEDVDAQARASLAGWQGLYTPDVIVAHHHRRKAADVPALSRAYALGRGAYMAKLLLVPAARPIVFRHLYWSVRKVVRGSYGWHAFMWEMAGVAGYLAHRLRKLIAAGD
jgi:glycosyltransferase involved in cell wall biosynthesis